MCEIMVDLQTVNLDLFKVKLFISFVTGNMLGVLNTFSSTVHEVDSSRMRLVILAPPHWRAKSIWSSSS